MNKLFQTLGLCLCALSAPLPAIFAGTLRGTVTEQASGRAAAGATITVRGSEHRTRTNASGEFQIDNLAAGRVQVDIAYSGVPGVSQPVDISADGVASISVAVGGADAAVVLDKYVVESIALGQARAISKQRSLDTVASILSADALGNLPDTTVGQALNRLPGINVVDDNEVSIRGSEAQLNNISLDGTRLNTPSAGTGLETTRAVGLADIPVELVAGIEVYKVLLPNMDADSFGGQVNLLTKSTLELDQQVINGKFEYRLKGYNANYPKDADSYIGSVSLARKLTENLGVSLSVSYTDQNTANEQQNLFYYAAGDTNVRAIGAITDEALNEADRIFTFVSTRRIGITAGLDFRLSDSTTAYVRLNDNRASTDSDYWRVRMRNLMDFNPTSTDAVASGRRGRVTKRQQHEDITSYSTRYTIGGETKLPGWKADYQIAYTDASNKLRQNRTTFEPTSTAVQQQYDWTVDRTNPRFPLIAITHRATGQDALLREQDLLLGQLRFWDWDRDDENIVGQLNVSRKLRGSRPTTINAGLKYIDNLRDQTTSLRDFAVTGAPVSIADVAKDAFVPNNLLKGSVQTLGTFAALPAVNKFLADNPSRFVDAFNNAGNERFNARFNDFTLGEKIYAGYASGTTDIAAVRAIYGLRYEVTDSEATWNGAADGRPRTTTSNYGNLFPSLNLTYRFGAAKRHVLRAAWTNTIARPKLTDILSRNSVSVTSTDPDDLGQPGTFTIGNPDLKAQEAMNYDLSYEFYFKTGSIFGVQVYYKDIKKFIYTSSFTEIQAYRDKTSGELLQGNFTTQQPKNGQTQKVKGAEVSFEHRFKQLPGVLGGLGLIANATFLDGESVFLEQDPVTRSPVTVVQPYLLAQPDRIYNGQVYWEGHGVTIRLAYNYRGSFSRNASTRASLLPVQAIAEPQSEWSLQGTYRISRRVSTFLGWRNTNRTPRPTRTASRGRRATSIRVGAPSAGSASTSELRGHRVCGRVESGTRCDNHG